jgi:signal transduction histidine kinase
MQNINRKQSTYKTSPIHGLQDRGSKAKQSRLETSLPPSSLANADADEIVFSSQKSQFAEYTTWRGIQNKTGIEKEDAISFLVKELLDNALDYLETMHYHNTATNILQPEIHIVIERIEGKYIRITVCNSNTCQFGF